MDKKAFYATLRRDPRVFGTSLGKRQVAGIEGLLKAFDTHGDGQIDTLAYGLATAYHETARAMVPIKETVMSHHRDKNPSDDTVIRRLDAWARRIGRTTNIYWRRQGRYNLAYFGRGHVQLTWELNYQRSSADAGVDLLRYPDKMLDPVISARVLWGGLLDGRWNGGGNGLRHYLEKSDLQGARRTVNITDQWHKVAEYHYAFLGALEDAGWTGQKAPAPAPRRERRGISGLMSRLFRRR